MDNEVLYLLSSNACEEYMLDVLESMALPDGMILHFRYQNRWIPPAIRQEIPKDNSNTMSGKKVAVCYLYQKKDNYGCYNWVKIYPVRSGVIKFAYKTGDDDSDVSHFYFNVKNYFNNFQDISKRVTELAKNDNNKFYVLSGITYNEGDLCILENSKRAFIQTVENFDLKHFISIDEEKEYHPFFCKIDGFINNKLKVIAPEYDNVTKKAQYKLKEFDRYAFNFTTYTSMKIKTIPKSTISLITDEKIFITKKEYKTKQTSRYDEESWNIISSHIDKNLITIANFKVTCDDCSIKNPLCVDMNIYLSISRDKWLIMAELGADICFVFGTAVLASSKFNTINNAWWIGLFAIGIICKIYQKMNKGFK